MVDVTMLADGLTGVVSIYTGTPSDESPHDDPLNNLDRLKFHSSLAYPKVILEVTTTVNFPARTVHRTSPFSDYFADVAISTASYFLFSHGQAGQPWVLGSALVGGNNVAFTGSVPVQQATQSGSLGPTPWMRWVSIGSDASSVWAYEYTVVPRNAETEYSGVIMSAISIPITVWVTDELLS